MAASRSERAAVTAACLVAIVTLAQFAAGKGHPAALVAQADESLLTYYIAPGDEIPGYRSSDLQLATWAFDAWARNAAGALRIQQAQEREALVRLYWAPPNGSTYGEIRRLVVAGRPGAAVFVRPDTGGLLAGPDGREVDDTLWRDTIVYLTCLHELGHALGLAHTADDRDIMYSFSFGGDILEYFSRYRRQLKARSDIPSVSGLSNADVQRLRSLHPIH